LLRPPWSTRHPARRANSTAWSLGRDRARILALLTVFGLETV
jgi:hypothetical protein